MGRVNFDGVAKPYRWLEYLSFGPFLARCRNVQLKQLEGAHRALVLGDGDGRFLARLLALNRTLTADVVDSSQAMLRLLEQRSQPAGLDGERRLHLHHADAVEWRPCGQYDLIITHFFLDCFSPEEVDQLLDHVLPHAVPGAQWVVSEFAIPRHPLAAAAARLLVGLLYRVFAALTGLGVRQLPDYACAFRRHGLVLRQQRCYLGGLVCSEVWCLPTAMHPEK